MKGFIKFIIVVLFVLFIVAIPMFSFKPVFDYNIFNNIEECDYFETSKADDVTVTKYATPQKDKYLKNLTYAKFYGAYYESKKFEFEIPRKNIPFTLHKKSLI